MLHCFSFPFPPVFTHRCDLGPHVAVGDVSMRQQLGQLRGVLLEEINHRWVAPEGIRENHFTEKSDVVSHKTTGSEVSICNFYCFCHRIILKYAHMALRKSHNCSKVEITINVMLWTPNVTRLFPAWVRDIQMSSGRVYSGYIFPSGWHWERNMHHWYLSQAVVTYVSSVEVLRNNQEIVVDHLIFPFQRSRLFHYRGSKDKIVAMPWRTFVGLLICSSWSSSCSLDQVLKVCWFHSHKHFYFNTQHVHVSGPHPLWYYVA